MERFRRNKGPLLLPVLCLAAALLIYLVVNSLWGAASVARQLSLGQQYLTDMNYNAAILAFNNAIRTDPVSKEAHIGLAKAYAGTGEYQFAGQMLEDLNQGPVPDEEISDTLIDIYTDAGEWERVIRLIREVEPLAENPAFDPIRRRFPSFRDKTPEEQAALIAENPDYGEIICRCETITRAEVLAALSGPLGAKTLTGLKYRCRAMMGRCQGGYCQTRLAALLMEATGKAREDLLYSREGSWLFTGKVRDHADNP